MKRRDFMTACGVGSFAALTGGTSMAAVVRRKRPNLLFVFTDQQSFDMLGITNDQVDTPNMDALAKNGIHFRHAVSSQPICSPFRAMLFTGQHPLYNGVLGNDIPLLTGNCSFAEALSQNGYETAYVGKWHLYGEDRNRGVPKGPDRHGFDHTFLTDNCHVDYRPDQCYFWDDNGQKVHFKDVYKDRPWEVEAQTRQALEFLENRSADNPFALFVSWHPPHDWGKRAYPGVDDRQYKYDAEGSIPEILKKYQDKDIRLRPGSDDSGPLADCRREQYRNYMSMISGCDQGLGQLMDQLKKSGDLENTLVVFTSDHGDMLGSHGCQRPKQVPQDYSVRIPLIMSWKNQLPENRSSNLLVGPMDLMPTILSLMGLAVPESVQGRNLSPAIREGNDSAVESVPLFMYCASAGSWRGVYTQEWTYARDLDGKATKLGTEINVLYNRNDDPGQLNNLYGNPDYADVQERLAGLTRQWMEHFGDRGYTHEEFCLAEKMSGIDWRQNRTVRPIDRLRKWIPRKDA